MDNTSTGTVFSTGLEKSKFAPPEVKAIFGVTGTFITPPRQSKAIPVVRPNSNREDQSASAAIHTPVTKSAGLSTSGKDQPSSSIPARMPEETTNTPPGGVLKQSNDSKKPLPTFDSVKDADHSQRLDSASKAEASPQSRPITNSITAVGSKINLENDGDIEFFAGKTTDANVGPPVTIDLTAANAPFKSRLEKAAKRISKAAEVEHHESKESMKPVSPKIQGKQDFLVQMMAGLQDFKEKQGPKIGSNGTLVSSGVASPEHDAPRNSLEVKSLANFHQPEWKVVKRPQPKEPRSSHTISSPETYLAELNKSIVKVKNALKNTNSGSFVLNVQHFAIGLATPATGSGGNIQIRLSTVDLRDSGEAELSLQIRCDDMKTVLLIFKGSCLLTNPALETAATIKVSRTAGTASFLTKRQPSNKDVNVPVIYGIEYMIPADDPGVKVRQGWAKPSTVECKSQSTLQFLQLWDAFRDPGAKKFAVRFPGDEDEAAAMWARVESFLKKVDEQACNIEGHKWVKKVSSAGGKAYWKLVSVPWLCK